MNASQRFLILVAASVFGFSVAAAQTPAPAELTETGAEVSAASVPGLYTGYSPFRLFDPSRLSLYQSYSLSYFSGGFGSSTVGVYMNSIGYRISDPLYVQVDLGLVHSPGALFGGDARNLDARIRPNFHLRYAPSQKFNLIVDIRSAPTHYGPWGYPSSFWTR